MTRDPLGSLHSPSGAGGGYGYRHAKNTDHHKPVDVL